MDLNRNSSQPHRVTGSYSAITVGGVCECLAWYVRQWEAQEVGQVLRKADQSSLRGGRELRQSL